MWGFNSNLTNVVNVILAKIEGRSYNPNAGNAHIQNQMQGGNINVPQMNPNSMVYIIIK
jgi:hypothetical protein